jgi:carbamoyl-phosphate synthase large subunit
MQLPPFNLREFVMQNKDHTKKIALGFENSRFNHIQFAIKDDMVYILKT